LEKRIACETTVETVLPPADEWKDFADYSFNPDDFHSDANPCYNCVTWATTIGNKIVPGFLEPVRQGRMKLMVRQFRQAMDDRGGSDG